MQYSKESYSFREDVIQKISQKKMPLHVYYADLIKKYNKDTKSMSPINGLIGLFKMN